LVNKLLILLFFVLPAFFKLEAQYENILFSRLTVSDGLSQNAVSYICQDSRGFMWFATASGLNRYDGYNFKMYTYNPDNPGSISDNSITGIYEDPFYEINYVLGSMLALKYYQLYKFDKESFSKKYIALLKNGFNQPPQKLLKTFLDIDINDNNILFDDFFVTKIKVNQLEALYKSE